MTDLPPSLDVTAPLAVGAFEPLARANEGRLAEVSRGTGLIALKSRQAYRFQTPAGRLLHEYEIPDDSEILNCGGYIDKIWKYRSAELRAHLERHGVTLAALNEGTIPVLGSRSPQLDWYIHRIVLRLLAERGGGFVRMLDIGCTVAEHVDLLDVMLQVASGGRIRARDAIDYVGVDNSLLALCAARYLHADAQPGRFRLVLSDGAAFDPAGERFDISLCVGVMGNFSDPVGGTLRMIAATDVATVLACWVCDLPDGIWLTSHHAAPIYVFGRSDIRRLREAAGRHRLLVADFVPERASTQQSHYVGLSDEAIDSLGSYHLVITDRVDLFPALPVLEA